MADQVEQMLSEELSLLVKEFVADSAPLISCALSVDGDFPEEPRHFTTTELLSVWLQCPEGNFTPMFIGWCIANHVDPSQFGLSSLMDAVCIALTGKALNIIDGGFHDGTSKPH